MPVPKLGPQPMAPEVYKQQPTNNNNQQDNNPNKRNITIVVPFILGTSEKFKKLQKQGNTGTLQGTNTLRTLLGNPKDKDPKINQNGIIYPLQVPPNKLPQGIHRRIRQIPR